MTTQQRLQRLSAAHNELRIYLDSLIKDAPTMSLTSLVNDHRPSAILDTVSTVYYECNALRGELSELKENL